MTKIDAIFPPRESNFGIHFLHCFFVNDDKSSNYIDVDGTPYEGGK